MRKKILVLLILLSLTSCKHLLSNKDEYHVTWYVKNNLEHPIKVVLPLVGDGVKQVIFPNDSAEIFSYSHIVSRGKPTFDVLYNNVPWDRLSKENQRIDILSHKEVLIKTWYFTKKDDSDKQFFNKEYWKFHIRKIPGAEGPYGIRDEEYRWVFEIVQEDLAPINME